MDLNEVAIFIKVIQKGSFTSAAIALEMPKSTVSTKISNLEKRLGTSLITRSTRKIRLTPAGEAFFLRSTKAIEEITAAEQAVRLENTEPQGRFRITAPVDIGNAFLPGLVAQFLKKFPKVQFDILLTDKRVDFLEEKVDLALRAGELKDSSLIAKKVGEASFQIYASAKYIKDYKEPFSVQELKSHVCIHFPQISSDGWLLKNGKKSVHVEFEKKIIVNNLNLVYGLALEGAAIALLPSFLCQSDLKSGKLISILPEWSSQSAPLHFVYPAQKYVSPVIKAFIEMSSATLKNRFLMLSDSLRD